jgi:hypothetical protein
MSVLYTQVVTNNYTPVFGSVNSSTINANTIIVSTINAQTTNTSSIYAEYARISSGFISSISTTSITLDGNTIDTAGSGFGSVLLLNGIPIATTSNLSSIADWAYEPAISTVQMAGQNLSNANIIQGNSLSVVVSATVPLLNSGNVVNSNAMTTNTLLTTGLQTALGGISSTTFLNANQGTFSTLNAARATIPILNATTATISSLSGNNFTASTGTFSSITGSFPPVLNYSTLYVSTLSSVNIVGTAGAFTTVSTGALSTTTLYAAGGTFANGPTFAGTRPSFTTGINTIGADLGSADLNSVGDINGTTINMTAGNTMKLQSYLNTNIINDRSVDVADHSVINIDARNGSGGIVNITGSAASVLGPVVASQVNLSAAGNTAYTANSPIGGKVTIGANAGGASIAFPVGTILAGGGEVDITANSYIGGTGITPGLVKVSGGSCSMYSGPVSAITGVYGYNYIYGTLGNYFAAGSPPGGVPNFAGTNFLYGTNGTSIRNGLFTDTIANYGSDDLNIYAKTGNKVYMSTVQTINMANNASIIAPYGGTGYIIGFSNATFTGDVGTTSTMGAPKGAFFNLVSQNIEVPYGGYDFKLWVPSVTVSGTTTYYDASISTTKNINLNPGCLSGVGTINANGALIGTSTIRAPVISTLNINLSTINGAAYTPGGGGGGSWISTATSALNMGPYPIQTSSITGVSTINGAAYPPPSGASTWVSTATSALNMGAYPIAVSSLTGVSSIQSSDNIQITAPTSINIATPGNIYQSATNGATVYTTLTQTSTNMDFYQVGGAGAITTHVAGNLVDIVSGNIQTSATSTINTVAETRFTGDIRVSSLTQTLIGNPILQPVLQYSTITGTGNNGTVTVTIPQRYTSQTSYIPFAMMMDDPPAQLFTSSITRASFIIGWTSGGAGTHTFGWQTVGT